MPALHSVNFRLKFYSRFVHFTGSRTRADACQDDRIECLQPFRVTNCKIIFLVSDGSAQTFRV
jgi:hypothetical protein